MYEEFRLGQIIIDKSSKYFLLFKMRGLADMDTSCMGRSMNWYYLNSFKCPIPF